MAKQEDDGFLSRWSRLKERARDEGGAEASVPEPSGAPAASAEEPEQQATAEPDEAAIVAALPDIDSLDQGSDFSVFMQKGVPAELRRLALRKLWRVNPLFNLRDGLNDYDLDYRAVGEGLGQAVNTLYQVGKGMRGREPEPAAAQEQQDSPAGDQGPGAEAAEGAPESAPEITGPEAEREAAEGDQSPEAVPGRPKENQPGVVVSTAPAAAGGAAPDAGTPPGRSPADGPKGDGAAARRWGRFTT